MSVILTGEWRVPRIGRIVALVASDHVSSARSGVPNEDHKWPFDMPQCAGLSNAHLDQYGWQTDQNRVLN